MTRLTLCSEDGTVHLKDPDIASLSGSEDSSLFDDKSTLLGETSSRVERNESHQEALQINSAIGIGGYAEVAHVIIVDNKALDQSIQVNHAISQENFNAILLMKLKSR